jgi:hypothetical protein
MAGIYRKFDNTGVLLLWFLQHEKTPTPIGVMQWLNGLPIRFPF